MGRLLPPRGVPLHPCSAWKNAGGGVFQRHPLLQLRHSEAGKNQRLHFFTGSHLFRKKTYFWSIAVERPQERGGYIVRGTKMGGVLLSTSATRGWVVRGGTANPTCTLKTFPAQPGCIPRRSMPHGCCGATLGSEHLPQGGAQGGGTLKSGC